MLQLELLMLQMEYFIGDFPIQGNSNGKLTLTSQKCEGRVKIYIE